MSLSVLSRASTVAYLDSVLPRFIVNGDVDGAIEWLGTEVAQQSYIAHNARHALSVEIAERERDAAKLAIKAIKEAAAHSQYFETPEENQAEAIRLRLMVTRANIASDHDLAYLDNPEMLKFAHNIELAKRAYSDAQTGAPCYRRFETFDEMKEFACAVFKLSIIRGDNKVWAEAAIYSDDSNLTHRAQVNLVCERGFIALRWNAFTAEPDISFIGKRSRVEARDKAAWLVDQVQAAFLKPAIPVSHATYIATWAELTVREQSEANARGFSREPGTRYEVKKRYQDNELTLVRFIPASVSI